MTDQPGKPREWTIVGGLALRDRPGGPPGNYAIAHCDGPIPVINERVPVIEKSAYDAVCAERDALKAEVAALRADPTNHDKANQIRDGGKIK